MANSHDPHDPFHGSEKELPMRERWGEYMRNPSRVYNSSEVEGLGFLPDLPGIKKQVAQYHSSSRRCDDTVGEILRALDESGYRDNTLVMFLSDNGMAFPFAKCNCYLNSTKTPWIIRWPGHVQPGTVDDSHFISGIDFMPTILEAAGISQVNNIDGRSFMTILEGAIQKERDCVYTVFYKVFPVAGGRRPELTKYYPMRCVQNRKFGYIYNKWSDGEMRFAPIAVPEIIDELKEAGKSDVSIRNRLETFLYRVPEEFYNFDEDPNALNNLINNPEYSSEIEQMRNQLKKWMAQKEDPLLDDFQKFIGIESGNL